MENKHKRDLKTIVGSEIGRIFDLSTWKLQTPIPRLPLTGVLEIAYPELASYKSKYFFSKVFEPKLGLVMWVPENGATTTGSKFPRCQLF